MVGIGGPVYWRLNPYVMPSNTTTSLLWPVAIWCHLLVLSAAGTSILAPLAFGRPCSTTVLYSFAILGYAVLSARGSGHTLILCLMTFGSEYCLPLPVGRGVLALEAPATKSAYSLTSTPWGSGVGAPDGAPW